MLKLKKIKATEWKGTGFGTTRATWTVAGHEDITVVQLGEWYAVRNGDKIARGFDRAMLLEILADKLIPRR